MIRYLILFSILLFLFISCKSIEYSSIFKEGSLTNRLIVKDINNNNYYFEELTLNNNLKVLVKQTKQKKGITFSLYLKNPPLYQALVNCGIEYILSLYIKEMIFENLKKKDRLNENFDISITATKDLARISFNIDSKNDIELFTEIIGRSIIIDKFNEDILQKVINHAQNDYQSYILDKFNNLEQRLERTIFKTRKIQNLFYGNYLSLRLIKIEDVIEYYKENFTIERLLLFINGDIDKKDIKIEYFDLLSNFFINSNKKDLQYDRLSNKDFKIQPFFYEDKIKGKSYICCFHRAPSFLNDEYFAYLMALKFLEKNLSVNLATDKELKVSSKMINVTNYGMIMFSADDKDILSVLLSFKKVIEVSKKQYGFFYFYKDNSNDVVKDSKFQDENKLINNTTSIDFDNVKEDIFEQFNFEDINSDEKEIRFMSIYLLLGQTIDPYLIKDKIDSVGDEDIIKIYDKYFSEISWGGLLNIEMINSISKDFFY